MPEGPQARQAANLIARHVGEELIEIRHPVSRQPWALKLPALIERVETKGKHIFVHMNGGEVIYNHMLMWGWWLPTAQPVAAKRLNTAFVTNRGEFGYFGGGILKLISLADAALIKAKLGPDILAAPDASVAFERVQRSHRPIGEALLDQSLVCGIGNIYKSEGLFVARINPVHRASNLTSREYERLFDWLRPQMLADVGRPGKMITTTREAAKRGHGNFVYRRSGEKCLLCFGPIERIYQGVKLPRSTYFCPRCQPLTTVVASRMIDNYVKMH